MRSITMIVAITVAAPSLAAGGLRQTEPIPLDARTPMTLINGRALWVEYRGRKAMKLAPLAGQERATDQEISAVLTGTDFEDGTIEVDVAGARPPGRYESYVELEAGAWTTLRIVVAGATARLYVNGAGQPSLVVNDLRHGVSRGRIALWTRVSSEAYFSNLRVTAR